ncbi:hypothetical protein LguiA_003662 [Lonicera macranthoides]
MGSDTVMCQKVVGWVQRGLSRDIGMIVARQYYYLPRVLEDCPLSETCTNLIDTSFIVTYGDSQKKYGPLMSLQLGFVLTLVVFSAKMATEVMKIHDLIFCNGSSLRGLQKLSYKGLHIVVLPYNDSWRDRVEKDRHSSSI